LTDGLHPNVSNLSERFYFHPNLNEAFLICPDLFEAVGPYPNAPYSNVSNFTQNLDYFF